jgi:hypothetical protein
MAARVLLRQLHEITGCAACQRLADLGQEIPLCEQQTPEALAA